MDMRLRVNGGTHTISALYEARQEVGPAVVLAARDVRAGDRDRGLSAVPALVRARRGAGAQRNRRDRAAASVVYGRAAVVHNAQYASRRSVGVAGAGRRAVLEALGRLAIQSGAEDGWCECEGLQDRVRLALCVLESCARSG